MWPLKKRTEEVKEDQRGKNPASLAALAQINAEKRATRRAEREELERLRLQMASREAVPSLKPPAPAPSTAPTVATSSTSAISNASQFFEDMMRYEQWKQTVYNVEEGKRQQIRAVLEKEWEARMAAQPEEQRMDPMMEQAGRYLMDLLFKAGSGANTAPLPPGLPQAAADPAQQKLMPPEAPAAAPGPALSNLADPRQAEADELADILEDKASIWCADVRAGAISKEEAISRIQLELPKYGKDPALAPLIYAAIMDVEE